MAKNRVRSLKSAQSAWAGTVKLYLVGAVLMLLAGLWMAFMPGLTELLPMSGALTAPSGNSLRESAEGRSGDGQGLRVVRGDDVRPTAPASGRAGATEPAARGGVRLEDHRQAKETPVPRPAAKLGSGNIAPPTVDAVALLIDSATAPSGEGPKGELGFTPSLSAGGAIAPETGNAPISQTVPVNRDRPDPTPYTVERAASQHGVEIASAQAVAGGRFIDVRYRVVDPLKAVKMVYKGGETYMSDSTGRRVSSRLMPKIGPAYVARHQAVEGSMYSAIFPNVSGEVKSGDLVTIGIGDLRVEQVRIQ